MFKTLSSILDRSAAPSIDTSDERFYVDSTYDPTSKAVVTSIDSRSCDGDLPDLFTDESNMRVLASGLQEQLKMDSSDPHVENSRSKHDELLAALTTQMSSTALRARGQSKATWLNEPADISEFRHDPARIPQIKLVKSTSSTLRHLEGSGMDPSIKDPLDMHAEGVWSAIRAGETPADRKPDETRYFALDEGEFVYGRRDISNGGSGRDVITWMSVMPVTSSAPAQPQVQAETTDQGVHSRFDQ